MKYVERIQVLIRPLGELVVSGAELGERETVENGLQALIEAIKEYQNRKKRLVPEDFPSIRISQREVPLRNTIEDLVIGLIERALVEAVEAGRADLGRLCIAAVGSLAAIFVKTGNHEAFKSAIGTIKSSYRPLQKRRTEGSESLPWLTLRDLWLWLSNVPSSAAILSGETERRLPLLELLAASAREIGASQIDAEDYIGFEELLSGFFGLALFSDFRPPDLLRIEPSKVREAIHLADAFRDRIQREVLLFIFYLGVHAVARDRPKFVGTILRAKDSFDISANRLRLLFAGTNLEEALVDITGIGGALFHQFFWGRNMSVEAAAFYLIARTFSEVPSSLADFHLIAQLESQRDNLVAAKDRILSRPDAWQAELGSSFGEALSNALRTILQRFEVWSSEKPGLLRAMPVQSEEIARAKRLIGESYKANALIERLFRSEPHEGDVGKNLLIEETVTGRFPRDCFSARTVDCSLLYREEGRRLAHWESTVFLKKLLAELGSALILENGIPDFVSQLVSRMRLSGYEPQVGFMGRRFQDKLLELGREYVEYGRHGAHGVETFMALRLPSDPFRPLPLLLLAGMPESEAWLVDASKAGSFRSWTDLNEESIQIREVSTEEDAHWSTYGGSVEYSVQRRFEFVLLDGNAFLRLTVQ